MRLGTKNRELRERIAELHKNRDFDAIGGLPGFQIFEIRDWRADTKIKYGCVTWVFNGDRDKVRVFTRAVMNDRFPEEYVEATEPQENDIVTYFGNKMIVGRSPTHLGIYIGNGRVRSKFRESHVYDHNLEDIPAFCGDEAVFYRSVNGD